MPTPRSADDTDIREQAYYFWEQDGRPDGRETEYWQRAVIARGEPALMAKPAPKTKAKAEPAKRDAAKKPKKK